MEQMVEMISRFGVSAVAIAGLAFALVKMLDAFLKLSDKTTEALKNNTAALTELTTYIKGGKS